MENQTINKLSEEYETIDLREIIKAFIKNIWLILGITVITAILFFGLSSVLPKSYNIKTIIEVGIVPEQDQLKPIENPVQIVDKIDGDFYGSGIRQKMDIKEKNYPKIKIDNFSGNFISISANSSDTERVKSILKELGSAIISDYGPRAAQRKAVVLANIEVQKKSIKQLNNKIQSAEAEKKAIEAEVSSLNDAIIYNKEIGIFLALTSDRKEIEAKQQDIESLYLQIDQNEKQINLMNGLLDQMRPTAVITEPTVSQIPVFPRFLLNTALGAFLGFFTGIFFVLCREWWKKNA